MPSDIRSFFGGRPGQGSGDAFKPAKNEEVGPDIIFLMFSLACTCLSGMNLQDSSNARKKRRSPVPHLHVCSPV